MHLINGDIAVDLRGTLKFINDFDFKDVKRFYVVENHIPQYIRAWHGHKKEAKYVFVLEGAAQIAAVDMDTKEITANCILSGDKPQILYIPPRHFNGSRTLLPDTKIIYFSTATLGESQEDDFRRPAHTWDVWEKI